MTNQDVKILCPGDRIVYEKNNGDEDAVWVVETVKGKLGARHQATAKYSLSQWHPLRHLRFMFEKCCRAERCALVEVEW